MTFPRHNPAHQTFEYFCSLSGATDSQRADAATLLRDHVRNIRSLYKQPVGGTFPYHDPYFQLAYLVAYFPYYIEPVCHVLSDANLPDDLFARGDLKASFIGGGPGPEVLGFAAYLRAKAPELKNVQVNIFDREPTWKYAQQILLPEMLKDYAVEFGFSNGKELIIDSDLAQLPDRFEFVKGLSVFVPMLDYKKLLKIHYTSVSADSINVYNMLRELFSGYEVENGLVLADIPSCL